MDTVKFVEQSLNEAHERLLGSLKDITQEQLSWRPSDEANSIGELLWHIARAEDRMGRPGAGLGPELWESQEWYKHLGVPRDQSPTREYHIFRSQDAPSPRLENLLAYLEAVHQDTLDKLRTLSESDLDRVPDPERPERDVASYFRHMIVHSNHHHGQLDYIRGLKQLGWELAPGTGVVQR